MIKYDETVDEIVGDVNYSWCGKLEELDHSITLAPHFMVEDTCSPGSASSVALCHELYIY
jgi:hypothetical protein